MGPFSMGPGVGGGLEDDVIPYVPLPFPSSFLSFRKGRHPD